jgi:hypothetical protein
VEGEIFSGSPLCIAPSPTPHTKLCPLRNAVVLVMHCGWLPTVSNAVDVSYPVLWRQWGDINAVALPRSRGWDPLLEVRREFVLYPLLGPLRVAKRRFE